MLRRLLEDTTITNKVLKSHICNTSCIEINRVFAIFNKKRLGNLKVRPNHKILKGMNAA